MSTTASAATLLSPTLEKQLQHYENIGLQTNAGTIQAPIPVPVPIPQITGSRFLISRQDVSASDPGVRLSFVPSLVLDGPRDSRITVQLNGTTPVHANISRDFVFAPGTPEFDCAQVFAIVRETLTMYQRVRGGTAMPWAWNTGGNTDQITVLPRSGMTANAFYSRGNKSLNFFYYTPAGSTQSIYTCRSFEIVAHQAGHAILDGIKPGWLAASNPPQTGGLHESFADLTAIFLACSQLSQVETAIAQTKASLHDKNFLRALAEQGGASNYFPEGFRNADNNLRLSQVSNDVSAIAQVFTAVIYDVMADIYAFERNQQGAVKDPARILIEVSGKVCKLLLDGITASPAIGATYSDVINNMLVASNTQGDPPIYRTFLRSRATDREVVLSSTPLNSMREGRLNYNDPKYVDGKDVTKLEAWKHDSDQAQQNRSRCCGTMQHPEYTLSDQKKHMAGAVLHEDTVIAAEVAELRKLFNR